MNFDFQYFLEVFPQLLSAVPLTLILTVVSMLLSVVIALLLAIVIIEKKRILFPICQVYISFFRAVPTLVQLFLFYYGLPQLISPLVNVSPIVTVIVGLSFKQAAFLSEIFRAAILSVDKGQKEAAITVGLSPTQTFKRIVLPQAFRNALPGLGNTIITTFKETSLAFTLGVVEMFAQGKILAAASFKYMETYLALAFIYWGLVIVYTFLQSFIEKTIEKPYIR